MLDVSDIAEATQRDHPDVAIVALDGHQSHALDLISAIVKQASCPVIVDLDTDDEEFIDKAARRGIFAYVKHGEQRGLANTIDIALNRYSEFSRLHGAPRTGAIIEQAKGILMERHGISADQAFAELRSRARNTNQSVLDVAQAVTLSYPLFKPLGDVRSKPMTFTGCASAPGGETLAANRSQSGGSRTSISAATSGSRLLAPRNAITRRPVSRSTAARKSASITCRKSSIGVIGLGHRRYGHNGRRCAHPRRLQRWVGPGWIGPPSPTASAIGSGTS